VDSTTRPGRLGEPTEHDDEVFAIDMEQAGTRPDTVVRSVWMLRVREIIGQRVEPICLEPVCAQQIHEALGYICAPDAQPETLENTRVSPAPAADLQDPTRSTERVHERFDLPCDPSGHRRCLGGVLSRRLLQQRASRPVQRDAEIVEGCRARHGARDDLEIMPLTRRLTARVTVVSRSRHGGVTRLSMTTPADATDPGSDNADQLRRTLKGPM
jgi:hypothetical protein